MAATIYRAGHSDLAAESGEEQEALELTERGEGTSEWVRLSIFGQIGMGR